jgi:alpha-methylacyl-CoA racemase
MTRRHDAAVLASNAAATMPARRLHADPEGEPMDTSTRGAPLGGLRVLEMAAIGPVPFAGMVLADLGADVVRLDRPAERTAPPGAGAAVDVLGRGKRSVVVDLKRPEAAGVVLDLVRGVDVLIEGLRPGVMERLGVGPDECHAVNEQLVYGRMTGFGQDGPLAQEAGHDINYIAISGVLGRIGRAGEAPVPPLNLVGDFGGGAMFLVSGVMAALLERVRTGRGQVVDAAMVDGSMLLTAAFFGGRRPGPRGTTIIDSGAPFYDAYETSDGRYVSVGAIEPQFWASFIAGLGLDPAEISQQPGDWPAAKQRVADAIRTRTRDEWVAVFEGKDACVAAVLDHDELFDHPHHVARQQFVEVDGVPQPAPAPRFSRRPHPRPAGAPAKGAHTDEVLSAAGLADDRIASLRAAGVVA